MAAVMVDSNVLIDLMTENSAWASWSATTLGSVGDEHRLVINPIIYSEVSVRYSTIEAMEAALPRSFLEREDIPYEAAFLAGKVFLAYRRAGGARRSPLPDFFIGAHAAIAGYRLLTRDPRRYRTYYPKLDLIAPD